MNIKIFLLSLFLGGAVYAQSPSFSVSASFEEGCYSAVGENKPIFVWKIAEVENYLPDNFRKYEYHSPFKKLDELVPVVGIKRDDYIKKRLSPYTPRISRDIPDFPFKEACTEAKKITCEEVFSFVKEKRAKIAERNQKEWEKHDYFEQENRKIIEKNNKIIRQNDYWKMVLKKAVALDKVRKKEIPIGVIMGDDVFDDYLGSHYDPAFPDKVRLFSDDLNYVEKALQDYKDMVKDDYYGYIGGSSDDEKKYKDILERNAETEKKNQEILQKLEAFYTPEKLKKLLKDYYSILEERCVGCDYEGDIHCKRYECKQKCPDREFVPDKYQSTKNEYEYQGRCVLKKEEK